MLRDPQQITGMLTANAVISGPTNAPNVKGEFNLAPGAFQQFMFESLGGTVDYAKSGLELDVKLQQTPTAWLTAKGHAPMTLFTGASTETAAEHVAPAPGEEVDIQVASSPIDLGVVQGFTSSVGDVMGTLQANFKVTGSGPDPHLDGTIEVKGGAFKVPDLGTSYTGLDTRIQLEPDAIRISEMRILDNHDSALTVGGELGVHGRSVGGVDVSMKAEDFKVIDNELGNMRVDTDVHLTGEIRKPRVEGKVNLSTGTLDVAKLLERFASTAYSTEATEFPGANEAPDASERVRSNADIPAAADATKPNAGADTAVNTREETDKARTAEPAYVYTPPTPSVFETLNLNLMLGIPDDLVLRGRDIRPGGEGVSLGDLNITVGGQVQIYKVPYDTLRLTGDVHTIRGTYVFQGRRFEIMRDGRIRFIGGDEIDPILDLEARRVISSVEAFIRVRGTMRQPELAFRSNPPLDEADVLALIVFNQSLNELGEAEQVSLAQRAGDLATGYLASGLTRSIGNALNLSEFELQAVGDNGSGPSITVGQQVGKDLFFRVRQGFGSAQATEFILEYQLAQYLRLAASAAETSGATQRVQFRRVERGGIDLIFFFAY
jgi:translocation and assembly module TamB